MKKPAAFTPAALPRRTLAALATVVCALLSGCESETVLLAEINETEANEVVAALDSAHVPARKQPGKEGAVSVLVDASRVARAVETLQVEGLPRDRHAQMGEVFRKEGLISSPLEERARYLWALSQELAETVAQIDGVIKARVHVVLPERASGGSPPQPSSASVFIKHRPGYNLQLVVPQVKQLVSTSIPGLVDDRVTVVLVAAQRPGDRPVSAQTATVQPPVAKAGVATSAAASLAASAASQVMSASRIAAVAALAAGVLVLGGLAFVLRGRLVRGRASRPAALPEPQVTP